jgi:hypothetical protein
MHLLKPLSGPQDRCGRWVVLQLVELAFCRESLPIAIASELHHIHINLIGTHSSIPFGHMMSNKLYGSAHTIEQLPLYTYCHDANTSASSQRCSKGDDARVH